MIIDERLTGTVYKTLGLGLSSDQFSKTDLREKGLIPWESVSMANKIK